MTQSTLSLKDIRKNYTLGNTSVEALKGVSMDFSDHEFVAILGQSGCGKTTLLNIIGGLDQYTDGDLIINGVSTKEYKSRDWDAYRNRAIGFIFQSYMLISHQTVLANVELTMTLSGISKAERRRRAVEALKKVGLGDQLKKKPNQMSGGQMQRVAIARALVNDPDIILADEPTGALDSKTSEQVMDILKEVAKEKLVIMVTHNAELAEDYATRIIRLVDGKVMSDTPVSPKNGPHIPWACIDEITEALAPVRVVKERKKKKDKKKRSMSFGTALSLSFKNLLTKKGRTFLTAFAGAIGIIGIALILALSTGVQAYIDSVESDTLSSYPLQINAETVDFTEMMTSMMEPGGTSATSETADPDAPITVIRSRNMMTNLITSMANERLSNDLERFKDFAENNAELMSYLKTIEYSYATTLNVFNMDGINGVTRVNPSTVMDAMGMGMAGQSMGVISMMSSANNVWAPLPSNKAMAEEMYNVIDGRLPENAHEIAIAVTEKGRITDYALYALGLLDQSELKEYMQKAIAGEESEKREETQYEFSELERLDFRALPNTAFFEKQDDGTYADQSDDDEYIKSTLTTEGIPLKITGIVTVKENANSDTGRFGGILYSPELMIELLDKVNASEIVKSQKDKPETDVFTGIDFPTDEEEPEPTWADLEAYIATLPEEEAQSTGMMIEGLKAQGQTEEEILIQFAAYLEKEKTEATYDGNLSILGVADEAHPASMFLYPTDFEAKEKVVEILDRYSSELPEGEELKYTDFVGLIMSSVTTIINAITYILIGFVGISLVVSSIMIGIITYISVLERTREIGILRAIGASKRDISRVFNAETLIIGFISGLIGIGIPYAVSVPVNAIVEREFDIANVMMLDIRAAAALVVISMLLTFIGGLIPSRIAAKKDPVEALRTE